MEMSGVTQPLLVSAICSLIASIQRSSGLWRLQEVLLVLGFHYDILARSFRTFSTSFNNQKTAMCNENSIFPQFG